MTEERKPVIVHCHGCGHSWPVAHVPMEVGKFVRLLSAASKAGCPMCAGTEIFMGPRTPASNSGGER